MNYANDPAGTGITVPKLEPLDPGAFSEKAEAAAKRLNANDRLNNTTQLRRFYDELTMWNDRLLPVAPAKRGEAFAAMLPYIQMLRAKAAYAKGRDLVDENFFSMMTQLLAQVKSPETLRRAKLFFEAVMGFKKAIEKKRKQP